MIYKDIETYIKFATQLRFLNSRSAIKAHTLPSIFLIKLLIGVIFMKSV